MSNLQLKIAWKPGSFAEVEGSLPRRARECSGSIGYETGAYRDGLVEGSIRVYHHGTDIFAYHPDWWALPSHDWWSRTTLFRMHWLLPEGYALGSDRGETTITCLLTGNTMPLGDAMGRSFRWGPGFHTLEETP